MKAHRWRILAALFAGIALVMTLWAVLVQQRGARALAAYKRHLIASGEKLNLDSILPRPLAASENSLGLFREALASSHAALGVLTTNAPYPMSMVAPGKAMITHAQPDIRFSGTNSWDDLGLAIAANDKTLTLLQGLIEKPRLDFQIDYHLPLDLVPYFHLPDLKRAAQLENYAAMAALHRGDMAAAVTHVRVMLALGKSAHDECLVISQLVRIAIMHIALSVTWECLQSPAIQERDLVLLQSDWSDAEFLQAAQAALLFERIKIDERLEQMRESSATFRQAVGARTAGPGAPWYERLSGAIELKTKESVWRVALSYPDRLRALKAAQVLIESIRAVARDKKFADAFARQEKQLQELGFAKTSEEHWWANVNDVDVGSLAQDSARSLAHVLRRVYSVETAKQLVTTAIALKRFQLRHGTLPAELTELVPEFLPALPRDPMDGQPLRYHRRDDGSFQLYSIGSDGKDDNGDPVSKQNAKSFSWQNGSDLVWPQPATAEEIKAAQKSDKNR